MTTTLTLKEFIANELRERCSPAFYDGFQFITEHMKYNVVEACGVWELRKSQELSIVGFERNLHSNCCTSAWEYTWADYVQFNSAAEVYREQWATKERNARILREEQAKAEQLKLEQHRALITEQYEHIRQLVMAAKFIKQDITIALSKESIDAGLNPTRRMDCYKGLAVHKEASPNPKYFHYQLTHIASGLGLGFKFKSLTAAKTATVRFAELTDWTTTDTKAILSTKTVTALARAIRDTGGEYGLDHDAMALVNIDVKVEETSK